MTGEPTTTAIEMPVRTVRSGAPRSEFIGHLLAWLIRRANIAIAAVVTLTAIPILEVQHADAAPTAEARSTMPELAPGAAVRLPSRTDAPIERIDQEPVAQMPGTLVKPKRKPPTRLQSAPPPAIAAPSPNQLAELYTQVGRALAAAAKANPTSTLDLWPRFRWVNFMDAIKTPAKRAEAGAVLDKLLVEAKKLQP